MKLKPLEQWICDGCGEVIEKPEDGWFEWLTDIDDCRTVYGFRIVHHATKSPYSKNGRYCQAYLRESGCSDMHLDYLLEGNNSIVKMLSLLDPGPYHEPTFKGIRPKDIREWIEVFRRLHIPYYEEARQYWDMAISEGMFSGANEVYIYCQENLKEIINEFSNC